MEIIQYLAMTGAEYCAIPTPDFPMAWMACHFSPYSLGLSNLPDTLPKDSMLILNDLTPMHNHDANTIVGQLSHAIRNLQIAKVLLDFQRPYHPQLHQLADILCHKLPCPVGISEIYAKDMVSPVFLSAPPLTSDLKTHIAPWDGREIWLEAATDCACYTITEDGCYCADCKKPEEPLPFTDQQLHVRYSIETNDTSACFTLTRGKQEVADLLCEAASLGVSTSVGLLQQLG